MDRKLSIIPLFCLLCAFLLVACEPGAEEANISGGQTQAPAIAATDKSPEQPGETAAPPAGVGGEACADQNTGASMSYEEAVAIAQSSVCLQEGQLKETHNCNDFTGTWWIDLAAELPGCNPACVIDVNTGAAEINWRCTGALPPQETETPPAGEAATDDGWQTYRNERFGYSVQYPAGIVVTEEDGGGWISFTGPLVDNEHWPMMTIGHNDNDMNHPPAGVSVADWLVEIGMLSEPIEAKTTIAGQPALRLAHERSPQAYASDEFIFIKDGQLFRIMILHAGDKQDWDLYDRFLASFTFDRPASPSAQEVEPPGAWLGTIVRQPPGSQVQDYFMTVDGEQYALGSGDKTVRELIADAAWSGAQVELRGALSEMPGLIQVSGLEIVGDPPPEARDLSYFASPSASSVLPADRLGTYHEWSAVDGLLASPWCEGAAGSGVGEWIQLTFPAPIEVTMIQLDPGYDYDDAIFAKNNRLKKATFVFANGEEIQWDFEDERGLQQVPLARAPGPNIETTSVKVIIDEIYPGSAYDDACIGEIQVWGRPR